MRRAQTLAKSRAQSRKRPNREAPPKPGPFFTGKKLNAILCVLLAGWTIMLYSPVFGYPFVNWDDDVYVEANPHIHSGLSWNTIKWAFTSTGAANWHPLTWLSHALDCQLFGLNPAGHHLDSVLIHAANVVVLFLLLVWITKRVGPSLLVAALFAAHPINVESVAWVAERKNVLSTLFFLLAIAAYARYAQKPDWRRYLLVAALYAAGLMAKPMVITLPFLLLLLDYWPLERMQSGALSSSDASGSLPHVAFSRLVLEKVPLLFLSAVSAVVTVKAQQSGQAVRTFHQSPLATRIENAIVAYGLYLWKMLWPERLAVLYPHPTDGLPIWQVTVSALVLVGVTALVVIFRRWRYLPVGWFWFLGTLIPVIGLVQVGDAAMADRYAYVPLIGIFVMITWGLADLADARKVRAIWLVTLALCALTALSIAASRQIGYWDSDYDLWSHTLAVTERNAAAHNSLATALIDPGVVMTPINREHLDTDQKRTDEARQHFEEALRIRRALAQQNPAAYLPDLAVTLNNLGNLDLGSDRMDQARQYYAEALQIERQLSLQNPDAYLPNLATTLNSLGSLDRFQNKADEARQHYEEASRIYCQLARQSPDKFLPYLAGTLNNLGHLDLLQNRTGEARQHYEEVVKIDRELLEQNQEPYLPDMAVALNNLGFMERQQKQADAADSHLEEALKIYRQLAKQNPGAYLPDIANTLINLAISELAISEKDQSRADEAHQHYEEALKCYRQLAQQNPDKYTPFVAATLNSLGSLERNMNHAAESRADYLEALKIFQSLSKGDRKYAGDVASIEANLKKLGNKASAQ